MSKREPALYLSDIKDCIKKLEKYVKNMSFGQFCDDSKTIDAVVRNIEIIGEAANNMPKELKKKYPDIPWTKIIGMRNIISHEYFGIDTSTVWETVILRIPELKKSLRKIKFV